MGIHGSLSGGQWMNLDLAEIKALLGKIINGIAKVIIDHTTANTFTIGSGSAGDKYIKFAQGDVNKPGFKWDDTTNTMQFSDDGTTWTAISSGIYISSEISGATDAEPNHLYIVNNVSQVTITLPSTFAQFAKLYIIGKGLGGWKLAQQAGQTIHYAGLSTTTGATGYLESKNWWNICEILCITANTDFIITSANGELKGG